MPRLPLVEIIRRNLALILAPVAILVVVGVALGLIRKPTYTSEARLNVGGLDLTLESIAGYTTAVQDLAIAYARAIDASQVLEPVARKLGVTPLYVGEHVAATPIQGSPVIEVQAASKHREQAQMLADVTADRLLRYARTLNAEEMTSRLLLARFKYYERKLQLAEGRARRLPHRSRARHLADIAADVARLQWQAAAGLYNQSLQGQAVQNLVQKLTPASTPTSDRSSVLQQYAAGGLLAGLLIGLGLALARVNRMALRRFPPS